MSHLRLIKNPEYKPTSRKERFLRALRVLSREVLSDHEVLENINEDCITEENLDSVFADYVVGHLEEMHRVVDIALKTYRGSK